jgi:hypothetical protein
VEGVAKGGVRAIWAGSRGWTTGMGPAVWCDKGAASVGTSIGHLSSPKSFDREARRREAASLASIVTSPYALSAEASFLGRAPYHERRQQVYLALPQLPAKEYTLRGLATVATRSGRQHGRVAGRRVAIGSCHRCHISNFMPVVCLLSGNLQRSPLAVGEGVEAGIPG